MDKRGQFFLIATVVIAGIILSIGIINISTKTSPYEKTKIYDLSEEINYESSKVIDYGVYNKASGIPGNITKIVDSYARSNPDKSMVIIYGNASGFFGRYYGEPSGSTSIGGASNPQSYLAGKDITNIKSSGDQITVTLPNATLYFKMHSGENFFIVLQEKTGGENIVARTE